MRARRQLQEVDLSVPLRISDFFTNKGWFKLASKWGPWKAMSLFYLLSVVIIGVIFFILSTFYSFRTIGYVVSYTVTVPVLLTLIFCQQFKKVLEKK